MALLRNRDLTNVLFSDNADEEGFLSHWGLRSRRQPKDPNRFPKVPSEEGLKLMRAGAFGANDYDLHTQKHMARRMLERELGDGTREERRRNSDLVTQVFPIYCNTLRMASYAVTDACDRPWCRGQELSKSFTTMIPYTLVNFPTTGTSSTRVAKTSRLECTIRQTRIIGNITRPSLIHGASGL